MSLKQDLVDSMLISESQKGWHVNIAKEILELGSDPIVSASSSMNYGYCVKKFEDMHLAFLKQNSHLSVNISAGLTNRVSRVVECFGIQGIDGKETDVLLEIIDIFDAIAKELYLLMERDSFSRFVYTAEFNYLVSIIDL